MKKITLDLVADIMCPWCALSLHALEQAMSMLDPQIQIDLRVQPFELNPDAPSEGLPVFEVQASKYGLTKPQVLANFAKITSHGEKLGFRFNMAKRTHYYNSFDAHRLLYWAADFGQQLPLLHLLFDAYFTEAKNISDRAVLLEAVRSLDLDVDAANALLETDRFAGEVRLAQSKYRRQGITSVPTLIINHQYLVSGCQTAPRYAQFLQEAVKTA